MFNKTFSYAPEQMALLKKPARAYHLRYVPRRAVTINKVIFALQLMYGAITNY